MLCDKAKVLIIGAGAQAKYALEILKARNIAVVGVVDCRENGNPDWVSSYSTPVLPRESMPAMVKSSGATHFLACSSDAVEKRRLFLEARECELAPTTAVHPTAVIASTARIGECVIINPYAVIQPFVVIGNGCMIHAGSIVEHDTIVGDYVNLGPGVRLAGWCVIGDDATLFTGANLAPKVTIGAKAVVAAGATVVRNVEPGWLVAGVPAKPVRRVLDA